MYLANVPHIGNAGAGHTGDPNNPLGTLPEGEPSRDAPFVAPVPGQEESTGSQGPARRGSIMRGSRPRQESMAQMTKRVDFSLGMQDAASGDMSGDVYEDRNPTRIQMDIIEASRERSRNSSERARLSADTAHSSARDDSHFVPGNLARRSTSMTTHRNRFFSRHRPRDGGEEGMMENGMAEIPEESPANRIDQRTGLVSSTAWKADHEQSSGAQAQPPQLPRQVSGSGALGNVMDVPEGHRAISRSQTDNYEMRRL